MSGGGKRSHGSDTEALATERARNRLCRTYSHRARRRLYHLCVAPPLWAPAFEPPIWDRFRLTDSGGSASRKEDRNGLTE